MPSQLGGELEGRLCCHQILWTRHGSSKWLIACYQMSRLPIISGSCLGFLWRPLLPWPSGLGQILQQITISSTPSEYLLHLRGSIHNSCVDMSAGEWEPQCPMWLSQLDSGFISVLSHCSSGSSDNTWRTHWYFWNHFTINQWLIAAKCTWVTVLTASSTSCESKLMREAEWNPAMLLQLRLSRCPPSWLPFGPV